MLYVTDSVLESIDHLGKLIEKSGMAVKTKLIKNQIDDVSNVFFIPRGKITVSRKSDSLVILEVDHPIIIGLTSLFKYDTNEVYVESSEGCEAFMIKNEDALILFTANRSWFHVSNILGWLLTIYDNRDKASSQKNVYQSVSIYLQDIWQLPEETRLKTSLYKYILSRINVSRSALHKIIHELNYGNYIKTEKGKLLDLIKLPETY